MNPREVIQKSEVMRTNPYFHDFMAQHDDSLDGVINEIHHSVVRTTERDYRSLLPPHLRVSDSASRPQAYRDKLHDFLQNNNLYRHLNNESLKGVRVKNEAKLIETFQQGLQLKKVNEKELERIKRHNSKSKLPHERQKRLITSRDANRMKIRNYGKWYLKPDEFNLKVSKINKNLERLNQALGVAPDQKKLI